MTAVVALLSAGDAQRLTQRIKLVASSVRDGLYKLRNLVDEARRSNAWQVLGFRSWTEYLADTLGSEPMRLARAERQELVAYLAGEGMSTRAIAPIVGVDQKTVSNDLRREENSSPVEQPVSVSVVPPVRGDDGQDAATGPVEGETPDPVAVNPLTGEVIDGPVTVTETHTIKTVTGLDGKTYTKPEPHQPRRGSIIDDARNAGWQLRKAVERLERIHQDDRFSKNKAEILAALQPHLDFANEVISDL